MNKLPVAAQERGIEQSVWSALTASLYPGAREESVILVHDYCIARKLDPLKKPCHIVAMNVKDQQTGQSAWRDVIMPGIYEHRITAMRTGEYVGMDEMAFGAEITHKGVNAPSSATCTIYRMIAGVKAAFSHTEYFVEACATKKDGCINAMWTKRPIGQLSKCAEAGALRKAFPEELGGQMTVEEIQQEQEGTAAAPAEKVIEAEILLPDYSKDDFDANLPKWRELIMSGKKDADDLIGMLETKATFTDEMKSKIRGDKDETVK